MNTPQRGAEGVETLSLNDLPLHSAWPGRLLDAAAARKREKTASEVFREYETDKWSALLARLGTQGAGVDEVDVMQFAGPQRIPFSLGDELFLAPPLHTRRLLAGLIADQVHELGGGQGPVVELGAGTGSVITRLAKDPRFTAASFHAGDFSPSSVQVIDHLARAEGVAIRTGLYDFHASDSALQVPRGSVIFTSFAVAYVQGLDADFWARLMNLAPRAIVVAEPIYQHFDPTRLLGLLRRRYCEVNDYNRVILPSLQAAEQRGCLRLGASAPNAIGINPLCPVSLLTVLPAA